MHTWSWFRWKRTIKCSVFNYWFCNIYIYSNGSVSIRRFPVCYGIFRNQIVHIHGVGYRIAEASKMQHFVITVKVMCRLLLFLRRAPCVDAVVLDPPVIHWDISWLDYWCVVCTQGRWENEWDMDHKRVFLNFNVFYFILNCATVDLD